MFFVRQLILAFPIVGLISISAPAVSQVEDAVAQLEQFRAEKHNFHSEARWFFQRRQLAEQILEIEPNNALANLELAEQKLQDFYRFHNVVILPENVRIASGASVDTSNAPAANTLFVDDPTNLERVTAQGGVVFSMARRASSAYEEAMPYLMRTVTSDFASTEAFEHLMRIAVIKGVYEAAIPHIERWIDRNRDAATPWLYLGLAQHRSGNSGAALRSFNNALERMTPIERRVFEDVNQIRSPRDEDLTNLRDVNHFWRTRDPRLLTPMNERKAEHFARVAHADLMFDERGGERRGWDTDRGRVYIRYGAPSSSFVSTAPKALEIVNGQTVDIPHGPRLITWNYGDFRLQFFDNYFRNGEFTLYSPTASAFGKPRLQADRFDSVIRSREVFRETPERYDFDAPGRVEAPFRVTAFRGESGLADVYLSYGIFFEGEDVIGQRNVDLAYDVGAFFLDDDRLVAERRRSIDGLPRNQVVDFAEFRLFANVERLLVAPGDYEAVYEFETDDNSAWTAQRRNVSIPNLSGGGLKMSDILLAYGVEPGNGPITGAIFRDGLLIQPAPWGVYKTTDPIYLYFEIYGLGMDGGQTNYEVEAELRPKDDRGFVERIFEGREPGVSNTFPVQSDRVDDSQYVILDATGQPPGEYTLTVRIEDRVSGQSVERETELFLE